MHSVVVLDSVIGAGAMAATSSEYIEHSSHLEDSIFYGQTDAPDCPDKDKQCVYLEKSGVTTSIQSKVHSPLGMELHPSKEMHCPLSSQVENGSWAGKAYFKNLHFKDFNQKPNPQTSAVLRNTAIQLLPKSPDFITLQHFEDITYENCSADSMTYFFEPPESWGVLNDCGL
jgi:hypothetical protein